MVSSISMSRIMAVAMALLLAVTSAGHERANKSVSAGRFLSTGKDGRDHSSYTGADDHSDTAIQEEEGHPDGGFSSVEGMLQWAIGNSDPEKLKVAALDTQYLSSEDLNQRRLEINDLMEKLKMPSDAKLMQIAITDLNNASLMFEDRFRALQELLILVEPINNANDLHKLGGLTAIIRELSHRDPEIRTIAAWILGKAVQNNPIVQNQILELGALTKLIEMAPSNNINEALKALYAISALIRNNPRGQELFCKQDGFMMLQLFLQHPNLDVKLLRKLVFLFTDLAESQLDSRSDSLLPFFTDSTLLKYVVDLMASTDLDLQEKALYAVKNLLLLRYTDALVFKEICKLDVALGKMRQRLQQLFLDDDLKEYAEDVERLRSEVEVLFLKKLDVRNRVAFS